MRQKITELRKKLEVKDSPLSAHHATFSPEQKIIAFLLITICILLLLIAIGYVALTMKVSKFISQKNSQTNALSSNQKKVLPSPTEIQTYVTIPTTDLEVSPGWNMHTSRYGFEIKYPSNWLLTDDGYIDLMNKTPYGQCDSEFTSIQISNPFLIDKNMSFDQMVIKFTNKDGGPGPSGKLEKISLASHNSYRVEISGGMGNAACSGGPGFYIQQNDDSYIYIFTDGYYANIKNSQIVDQILSTFRFTQ